ncbi:MAG: iron-containing alcohol dehydrogenase [Solitalea-like symbiont of Acarus siro]
MYKSFNNVQKITFGRGSLNTLEKSLEPLKYTNNNFCLFIIDNFFKDKNLLSKLPIKENDAVRFINVDLHEPTTQQIDDLRDNILKENGTPSAIIGIGGGSILDLTKATALMFKNKGSSAEYQGLNLIQKEGVYHIGIPTIAGTGAEVSMTAVLTGPENKLGLKCDYTVFKEIILDPDFLSTVPKDKWFYTGMDTFIHCIESENGTKTNTFSSANAEESIKLCKDVYLESNSGQTDLNNEKLMIASMMGGLSLTYSEVVVCHALSYGLSKVLHFRHCYANCLIFNHLGEIYSKGVKEFKEMLKKNDIHITVNLSENCSNETVRHMSEVAYILEDMWIHAFGPSWKE